MSSEQQGEYPNNILRKVSKLWELRSKSSIPKMLPYLAVHKEFIESFGNNNGFLFPRWNSIWLPKFPCHPFISALTLHGESYLASPRWGWWRATRNVTRTCPIRPICCTYRSKYWKTSCWFAQKAMIRYYFESIQRKSLWASVYNTIPSICIMLDQEPSHLPRGIYRITLFLMDLLTLTASHNLVSEPDGLRASDEPNPVKYKVNT